MDNLNLFGCADEVYYKHTPEYQFMEMMALGFLGFMIPLTIGHPQLLVGAAVNAFIIRAALSLPQNKALPVILTPSLGALARGILFGPYTVLLVYMIPFIWAGNYILMYAFKIKVKNNVNYFATLIAGSLAKAGLIYAAAFMLYSLKLIPAIMLPAMGLMQLATALTGGAIVYAGVKTARNI